MAQITQSNFWKRGQSVFGCSVATLGLWVSSVTPNAIAQEPLNPELQIGVVQRFGSDTTDELVLEPLSGDQLTLQFETGGKPQTLRTNQVKLVLSQQALPQPQLEERVVLSDHRSFESAEDSANQWRQRGLEVEIAQPGGWQVWAKRDVYSTPLLRRLLLKSLQAEGFTTTYLESKVVAQVPKAAFIANGYRYNRDRFEITSANRRIRVTPADDPRSARLYGGDLRLQPNAYGTYTLVNDVPIETYLRGVVPHEIGLRAPFSAIEAQAVLARTYVLRNLRRFEIDDYQLCADTQCQVYWGLGGAAEVTDRAITATRGLVLTYNNELVDALYSSTTGGVTAPFSSVWNGPDRPYLKAVVDSVQGSWDLTLKPLNNEQFFRAFIALDSGFNEDDWDTFRWRRESTLADIVQNLQTYLGNRKHPLANLTRVLNVQVTERAPSGRVQTLTIQTDVGVLELKKDEIVRALWAPRSLLFYVDPIYDSATVSPGQSPALKGYAFVGGGLGHGVGMSQTGAYRLGALGWPRDRILQFYYPGTELKPISPQLTFWRDPSELSQGGS